MKCIEISAFELNCEYSFSRLNGHNCKAESLKIESPNLKITKVNGKHIWADLEVHSFLVHGNPSIKYLPIGLNDHFPKLKKLDVQFSSLRFISKNDFYDLNFMQIIDFSGNQIEAIPIDVFSTLIKLKHLNLSKNRIKKLYPSTFENLLKLQKLFLQNNQIEELDGKLFINNLEMKKISLSQNRLKIIGPKLVSHLFNLTHIEFIGDENCIKNNYILNPDIKSSLSIIGTDIKSLCLNMVEVSFQTFEELNSNLTNLDNQVSILQSEKNNLNQELVKEKKNLEDTKLELQQKIEQANVLYNHTVDALTNSSKEFEKLENINSDLTTKLENQNQTFDPNSQLKEEHDKWKFENQTYQNTIQSLNIEIENLKKSQSTSVDLKFYVVVGFFVFILIILLILSIGSSKSSVQNIETTLVMTEKRKSITYS